MSVLLVHMAIGFEESYPLALASLAAPLIKAGYSVDGLDVNRHGLDGLRRRLQIGDVKVVGMSVWSPGVLEASEVVDVIRRVDPSVTIVVGGPHPTLRPNDVMADAAVIGEGEDVFLSIVQAVDSGESFVDIDGVHIPGSGRATTSAKKVDLASLPAMDRTVFSMSDYHREHLPAGRLYTSDVTSRGCTYDCGFCSTPQIFGRQHRYRPPEQIWDNWSRLKVDYGIHAIMVEDDLFTLNKKRVIDLCEYLLMKPIGIQWELLNGVRPESLTPSLLQYMGRAGCTRLAVGIETASANHSRSMGRTLDESHLETVLNAARNAGMSTTGYFMLGLPGETRAERKKTFELATRLPIDMAHFSQASAWPGTKWTAEDLVSVDRSERAQFYAAFYLHPMRAIRIARVLGLRPSQIPDMVGRLFRWMTKPLEARRVSL